MPRSASRSLTSAKGRRKRQDQRTAVTITARGQRCPANGVPLRSRYARRHPRHRNRWPPNGARPSFFIMGLAHEGHCGIMPP
jgi:hypothetical protein